MRIVAIGASHRSAPLEELEAISIAPGELDLALPRLRTVVLEGWILSTCNRTEVCVVLPQSLRRGGIQQDQLIGEVIEFIARRPEGPARAVRDFIYVREEADAVRHVLRVASGLDSMVLGEDQIQAQFKRALTAARLAGSLGATLERLGAMALGCGKRVRTFTGIGRHGRSLESIAVETALDHVGKTDGVRAVVLGAGTSAGMVVQHLLQHGTTDVAILSRSVAGGVALARESGICSRAWEDLPDALAAADVVFGCTSAPHTVVTADMLMKRSASRSSDPLLCVDLGMPRDMDGSLAEIAGVSVLTLEHLGVVAAAQRVTGVEDVTAAEAIVERETTRFLAWLAARSASGAIRELETYAAAVMDAEVKRAFSRMTLDARERGVVADMARRIARKLVHKSIDDLKRDVGATDGEREAAS